MRTYMRGVRWPAVDYTITRTGPFGFYESVYLVVPTHGEAARHLREHDYVEGEWTGEALRLADDARQLAARLAAQLEAAGWRVER